MTEVCLNAIYWCDEEYVQEQRHMMLPYGTVVTQAKDQPADSEGFHITVDLPWGFQIRSNADLKDCLNPSRKYREEQKEEAPKKARQTG